MHAWLTAGAANARRPERARLEQLELTEVLGLIVEENVFLAQSRFGLAASQALAAAEAWIAEGTLASREDHMG